MAQLKMTGYTYKQKNMVQAKEQTKSPVNNLKQRQSYELPGKEFKVTVLKMLNELKGTQINN